MKFEQCPITGLETFEVNSPLYFPVLYGVNYNDESHYIALGPYFELIFKTPYFEKNRFLLAGAILTNQQYDEIEGHKIFTLSESNWETKIKNVVYPKTPKDKLDNLFKTLYSLQQFDGQQIDLTTINPGFWFKNFFKTKLEGYNYIKMLKEMDYIHCVIDINTHEPIKCSITYKGLNYFIDITESGNLSNKCFVAMSFGENARDTRTAIKEAIITTGYDPIIVDEEHIDSDTTINDAIIAGLKASKFCVSDFTEQKHGVYFESGYALGHGKPVIYCCQNNDFDNSHFDTKHFAHILYDTPNELKMRLIDKINAWIK